MRLAARAGGAGGNLAVFAGYLVLALVVTWPLVLHPASRAPGLERFGSKDVACDTWNQVWSLWWTREALADRDALEPGESLHETRHLFHPIGTTLALHTLFPLYGVLMLPLTLAAGPVVAWNALLWLLLALSGWATWRLARRWGPAPSWAAFAAGAAVAFSPAVMAHVAAGHLNLSGIFWLPLYLDALLVAAGFEPSVTTPSGGNAARSSGRRRLAAGLGAGALLAACAWAELYYVAFMLIATLMLVVAMCFARRDALRDAVTLRAIAIVAVVFAAGAAPVFLRIASALRGGAFMTVRGHGFAAADVLSYLVPARGTTALGGAIDAAVGRLTSLPQEWTLFPGYVFLALAVLGFRSPRRHRMAPWFAWGALAFVVLSLGTYLKVAGASEWNLAGMRLRLPLPYLAATQLPLFENLRSTGRFGMVALVLVAPLAAAGLEALRQRLGGARRVPVMAAVVLCLALERLVIPLPLLDARVPGIYATIAREPGRFAVLEIPFGLRDGSWIIGREESRMQLHQTVHRRPVLSGCVSRMREEVPRWFGAQPVTRNLLQFESAGRLSPEEMEFDRRLAAPWLREHGVKYILVHTGLSRPERDYRALADYLAAIASPVEVRRTPDGIIVLRIY